MAAAPAPQCRGGRDVSEVNEVRYFLIGNGRELTVYVLSL